MKYLYADTILTAIRNGLVIETSADVIRNGPVEV